MAGAPYQRTIEAGISLPMARASSAGCPAYCRTVACSVRSMARGRRRVQQAPRGRPEGAIRHPSDPKLGVPDIEKLAGGGGTRSRPQVVQQVMTRAAKRGTLGQYRQATSVPPLGGQRWQEVS